MTKNKAIATTFTLILLIISLIAGVQIAKAATIQPVAYLSVIPNPVGVNQDVLITMTLQPIPPLATEVFTGMRVSITKPDGTTENKGPFTSSPIGSQTFSYTPTQVGTYDVTFAYDGQTFSTDEYLSATSPVTNLVVQENPIPGYPTTPMPTDYWTRPINSEHRNWYTIGGNWLERHASIQNPSFGDVTGMNLYSQAPMSPHIMWTKELTLGGLIGGEFGSSGYYPGHAYEPKMQPPIIMNGRLYYNIFHQSIIGGGQKPGVGFMCIDLRTGEEQFRNTEGVITHGQIYNFESPNQMGGIPYLWDLSAGEYVMYDAFTGTKFLSFAGAQAGDVVYGNDGNILVHVVFPFPPFPTHTLWNLTKAFEQNGLVELQETALGQFRPVQGVYNWSLGIEWSVPIPVRQKIVPEAVGGGFPLFTEGADVDEGVMVKVGGAVADAPLMVGYDLVNGGELYAIDREETGKTFPIFTASGEGKFINFVPESRQWICYNIRTGQQQWISEPMEYPFGQYVANSAGGIIYDGIFYVGDQQGTMHAYDINDGTHVWKFSAGNSGAETPYGSWPMGGGPIYADGVIFCGIGEHSPTQPLMRGGRLFALDSKTGEQIWELDGWISINAIADGYLVGYNLYTNQIYCIGKGPTQAAVSAPMAGVTENEAVTIIGQVTDQSSGNIGIACVSDESMDSWMEYKHQQKAYPSDATGVTVSIDTIDPNGNFVNIGTATTDLMGNFGLGWNPEIPGLFQIMATFEGSEAYGSSYSTTYVQVNEAPQPTPSPEATPAPMTDTYVLGTGIAVLAAVVILGLLILRKK